MVPPEEKPKNRPHLRREGYERAKTLADAVKLVRSQITLDGKPEYAALLSEARVREAIRTAIASYEAFQEEAEERRFPGSTEHFQQHVKPACLRIADRGDWPAGCAFFGFYTLTESTGGEEERTVEHHGLGLRLEIATPEARFKGFGLPILDVFFGRFARPNGLEW